MRALWSGRQICSHNVSQKVKRIRRFSEEKKKKNKGNQGVFAEKGARFRGKRGLATPPPPNPGPSPPPPLSPGGRGFTENPRGGGVFQERGGEGQGRVRGIWGGEGGAEAPFTAKTSPFFGENALTPKKTRVFLFAEPLKSLEKKGETHKKGKENRKAKKARKSKKKKKRVGGVRACPLAQG